MTIAIDEQPHTDDMEPLAVKLPAQNPVAVKLPVVQQGAALPTASAMRPSSPALAAPPAPPAPPLRLQLPTGEQVQIAGNTITRLDKPHYSDTTSVRQGGQYSVLPDDKPYPNNYSGRDILFPWQIQQAKPLTKDQELKLAMDENIERGGQRSDRNPLPTRPDSTLMAKASGDPYFKNMPLTEAEKDTLLSQLHRDNEARRQLGVQGALGNPNTSTTWVSPTQTDKAEAAQIRQNIATQQAQSEGALTAGVHATQAAIGQNYKFAPYIDPSVAAQVSAEQAARGDVHPYASGIGGSAGAILADAPEILAAKGSNLLGATALAGSASASRAARGEQETGGDIARDFAINLATLGTGKYAGEIGDALSAGQRPLVGGAIRAGSHIAGGAGGALGATTADTLLTQGRLPTGPEAVSSTITGAGMAAGGAVDAFGEHAQLAADLRARHPGMSVEESNRLAADIKATDNVPKRQNFDPNMSVEHGDLPEELKSLPPEPIGVKTPEPVGVKPIPPQQANLGGGHYEEQPVSTEEAMAQSAKGSTLEQQNMQRQLAAQSQELGARAQAVRQNAADTDAFKSLINQQRSERIDSYTPETLNKMDAEQLKTAAADVGVAYDAPTTTIPRILDAAENAKLDRLSDRELYNRAKQIINDNGIAGVSAGDRRKNISIIRMWNEQGEQNAAQATPETPAKAAAAEPVAAEPQANVQQAEVEPIAVKPLEQGESNALPVDVSGAQVSQRPEAQEVRGGVRQGNELPQPPGAQAQGEAPQEAQAGAASTVSEPAAAPSFSQRILAKLDAASDAAEARIKKRGTRVMAGIDPGNLKDMTIVGAAQIAKGVVKFADWSAQMVQKFGETIRPHLAAIYASAHEQIGDQLTPDEKQQLRDATVKGISTKAAIRKATGQTDTSAPTTKARALAEKLKAESAGAARGFKEGQTTDTPAEANRRIMNTIAPPQDTVAVGKAIRAAMEARAKGEQAIAALKGRNEIAQEARDSITQAAKDLPQDLRGQFNAAIRDAKTATDVRNALDRMQDATARYELRSSWAAAKSAIDNANLTKMDPENRALARGAIQRLNALGEKLFPAGEDRFVHAQRRSEIEEYTKQLNDAATDAKAARVAAATKELTDRIDGKPETPDTPPPQRAFYQRLGDAVNSVKGDIRLKYGALRQSLGGKAYDAVSRLATVVEQRNGMVRRFLDGHLSGKDDTETAALRAGFLALGYHNNAEAIRSKASREAFQRTLENGGDEGEAYEAADQARADAAPGINDVGTAKANELRNNPKLMAAVSEWQKNVEPELIRIRNALGLPTEGWGDVDPKNFRLNLSTVKDAPSNLGLFGSDTNMKTTYDQEAFGTGEYVTDPTDALRSIVGKHLFMEAFRNATDTMRQNGLEIEPSKTYQRDGNTYAMINGREHQVTPFQVQEPKGEGVMERYYPKELTDAYRDVAINSRANDKSTTVDKIVNLVTKLRLALGIDVGMHGTRVAMRVGQAVARSGEETTGPVGAASIGRGIAKMVPWAGKAASAIDVMTRMARQPIGETMQTLLERIGADRGTGVLTKTQQPESAIWQNVLNWGHDAIQGNNYGMDTLGRRAVAHAYLHAMMGDQMRTLTQAVNSGEMSPTEAARTIEDALGVDGRYALSQEINSTMGYMNRTLRAGWINKTQFVDPFIGTQVGMIPNELRQKTTLGIHPAEIKAAVQRGNYKQAAMMVAGSLMASSVGTYVAKNLLNYARTGHFMRQNDDGHKDDVAIGGGLYLSALDPSDARSSRLLGVDDFQNAGSFKTAASSAGKAWLNLAMGTLFGDEATRKAFEMASLLATGTAHEPYLNQDRVSGLSVMKSKPGWQWPFGAGQILAEEAAKWEEGEPTDFGKALFRQTAAFAGQPTVEASDRPQITRNELTPEEQAKQDQRKNKEGPLYGKSLETSLQLYGRMKDADKQTYHDVARDRILEADVPQAEQDALMKKYGITPPPDLALTREHQALNEKAAADDRVKEQRQSLVRQIQALDQAGQVAKAAPLRVQLGQLPKPQLTNADRARLEQLRNFTKQKDMLEKRVDEGSINPDAAASALAKLRTRYGK